LLWRELAKEYYGEPVAVHVQRRVRRLGRHFRLARLDRAGDRGMVWLPGLYEGERHQAFTAQLVGVWLIHWFFEEREARLHELLDLGAFGRYARPNRRGHSAGRRPGACERDAYANALRMMARF